MARFKFTGKPILPKNDSDRPLVGKVPMKNGKTGLRCNFGIRCDSSTGYVEKFGAPQDVIKVRTVDETFADVKWDDRFNEDVLKSVVSYRKITIDLGEELGGRKEFISDYDAIEYLAEKLPEYDGLVTITGQVRKDWYKDRYYDKFVFDNVYAVAPDTKSKLEVDFDFYYNASCVDKDDWKSDKIIRIAGYVPQYINKEEGNKYIPQVLVFNASKYNLENEKHKALLDYKLKYMDVKNKTMGHLQWECRLVNGAESIEFDESQLTPEQKQQVELGIRTIDYFKPRGSIFGERITEYRMFDPQLTGEFASGIVDIDMSTNEFEEEVYQPAKEEKLSDIVAEPKAKTESVIDEIDDDDLF